MVCKLIHSDLLTRDIDKLYDIVHYECNNVKTYDDLPHELNAHTEITEKADPGIFTRR